MMPRHAADADDVDACHWRASCSPPAGQTVSEHALYPGRLIIGRTAANDLQIDSRFVSRHHCQIVTTAQSCVIEDLNSTNGIFLHSKRVRYHNLNDGDVVTIGQHELLYIDERGAAAAERRGRAARELAADPVLSDQHPRDPLLSARARLRRPAASRARSSRPVLAR